MDAISEFFRNLKTSDILAIVGIIIASVFAFIGIIVPIIRSRRKEREGKKEAKEQKKRELDILFQNYVDEEIYIRMIVTDPQSDTPEKGVPFFEYFADLTQRRPIVSRYICLLGGIGYGKTDALVHLRQWYIDEYSDNPSMPKDIRLYTLNKGFQKFLDRINAEIPQKDRSNCILLLDALDECEEARASLENTPENNPSIFMKNLAKATEGFAWVVVSCRQQFFLDEKFYPGGAGVKLGDFYQRWYQLYLQPFNREQVEKYLAEYFGPEKNPKKDEAVRIVFNCKEVFLRPMLLAHIDIILKEYSNHQAPLTLREVFDTIILYWIKREAEDEDDNRKTERTKELLNASLCTAAYMYKHNLNYLNDADYKAMCKEHGIDDRGNLLRVQSLLTNDKKEGFRFAHQSFYEHLLAYWFFLNPDDIDSLLGLLESTLPAFVEILNEDKEKLTEMSRLLGVEKVDDYTIATGLHNIGYGLYNLNHFSEAKPFYNGALESYRALEKEHPGEFIDDVAMTLGNLAILHRNTNHHDEAEKEYSEVLEIFRKLAKENPDAYMPSVATTLNNLGTPIATTRPKRNLARL